MENIKSKDTPKKITDEEIKIVEEFNSKITDYENNYDAVLELDRELQIIKYVEADMNNYDPKITFSK